MSEYKVITVSLQT